MVGLRVFQRKGSYGAGSGDTSMIPPVLLSPHAARRRVTGIQECVRRRYEQIDSTTRDIVVSIAVLSGYCTEGGKCEDNTREQSAQGGGRRIFFFLVAHALYQVLGTVQQRCRSLAKTFLADEVGLFRHTDKLLQHGTQQGTLSPLTQHSIRYSSTWR